MNKNTIVKIILLVFFIVFFSFIFLYFYEPNNDNINKGGEKTNFISKLFPFGNNNKNTDDEKNPPTNTIDLVNPTNPTSPIVKEKTNNNYYNFIPKIRQISNIKTNSVWIEKISKEEIINLNKGKKEEDSLYEDGEFSEIRFFDLKKGNVFQTYDFFKNNEKISNITIPRNFQGEFIDKNNFFIRYINKNNDLKTYAVTLSDKTENQIFFEKEKNPDINLKEKIFKGLFFEDNINNIFINKKNKKVFYTKIENNKNIGILTNFENEGKKKVLESEFKELNFSFNSEKIFFSNKTSYNSESIAFSLNPKNSFIKKINKSEKNLNGKSNFNFSKILLTYEGKGGIELYIKDLKNNSLKNLKISTLAEKCIWDFDNITIYCAVMNTSFKSKDVDNWYKGLGNFVNDIYKINTTTGDYEIVLSASYEGYFFDIIDLKIDDRKKYLYWIDKKTEFAWMLNLDY